MATPFFWGPWTFVVDGGFYLAAGSEKVMSWTGNWIGDHVVTPLAVPFHLEGSSQHSALKVVATSVVGKEGGTTYYVRVRNDGPDATNFYVYIGGVAP